jgi:hypothetical protein
MASNNGSKLTVFGLGFREHESRRMQQILRHYTRIPQNPGDRTSLFVELTSLAKDLNNNDTAQEEIQKLTAWLQNGGNFPLELAPAPREAPVMTPQPGHGRHLTQVYPRPFQHQPQDYPTRMIGFGRRLEGTEIEDTRPDFLDEGMEEDDEMMYGDDYEEWVGHGDLHHQLGHSQLNHAAGGGFFLGEFVANAVPPPMEEVPASHSDVSAHDQTGEFELGVQRGDQEEYIGEAEQETGRNQTPTDPVDSEEDIIECPVCAEEYPLSHFPSTPRITDRCDHTDKACLACINDTIDHTVRRGALHELACPLCPEKFDYGDIKAFATQEVFDRYDYLNMRASMPDTFIMCLGPNCGCGQEHGGGVGEPMMICHNCGFKTCVKHKLPWHENQTCEEFDMDVSQIERLEEEEATAKALAGTTRICPKCSQGVIKDIGCDHLRCRCGEEWCFVCMCNWENILRIGETAHALTCTYHPNRVQLRRDQKEAEANRMMLHVHGGEVSEALAQAREDLRRRRREAIRPLALKAAEERAKTAAEERQGMSLTEQAKKKRKVKLVPAWE